MFRRRRDAWVILKGCSPMSARGAQVELVEARARRPADQDGGGADSYVWAVFPEIAHGSYTVRVTYPSGLRQTAHLIVSRSAHAITLDEPRPAAPGDL